ncbi:MAG: GDP-L-fucose synthase [Syntrophobacterales bacterium]|jgi:GDP-L-fucose synthase|nr:GDP-L-fucose synthase [Syntrophobacterales bacterium]
MDLGATAALGGLRDKRITITGGKGFLGAHLVGKLQAQGYEHLSIADIPEYDLRFAESVSRMYDDLRPDVVVHLAANVGGIGYNQANPGVLFYDNAIMGVQLMHEGYLRHIEKFVALGTICSYPKFTPVPFKEDDLWSGYPEETNAPYGLAKKMMLVQSQAYRQQYGFNSIFILPVNLYGPGDNFSFRSSHVVPALIRKFHLANLLANGNFDSIKRDFMRNGDNVLELPSGVIELGMDSPLEDVLTVVNFYGISLSAGSSGRQAVVEVWGTGSATREFFYVEDAAEAILLAMERYNLSDPVNIGAGFEISIRDLAGMLTVLTGFKGRIVWNSSKPDGQPRRMLNVTRARESFGFQAQTPFSEGLKRTMEWYTRPEVG